MDERGNIFSLEHEIYLHSLKQKNKKIQIVRWLILTLFIFLWEFSAYLGWIDSFIFSSPNRIVSTFISMLIDGSLLYHIGITLGETILGFTLGTLLGLSIAILLWWNKTANRVLEPYLVVLNSLPKTALAPILIVWIGNNMRSILVISILITIVVTILNILNGFMEVDKDKIRLIYSFSGTKRQVLGKVIIPGTIPTIVSTLKVNIGLALIGVIIGEFLVAKAGLGYLIVYGSQIFKLDWVMMSVIILGILAALLYQLIGFLERKLNQRFSHLK